MSNSPHDQLGELIEFLIAYRARLPTTAKDLSFDLLTLTPMQRLVLLLIFTVI